MQKYIVEVYEDRTEWKNEAGKRHRIDGPAVEYNNGRKEWYINGKKHRENGPAVEWADGTKYWYRNGEKHRENGPAIEWDDGDKAWYLNGVEYTEEEFNKRMQKHTIKIDDVEIEISEESFQNLKKKLV